MNNQAMPSPQLVAVIEDDLPTSNQLKGWIEAARSGLVVHQWFTRDDAEVTLSDWHCDSVFEIGRQFVQKQHQRVAAEQLFPGVRAGRAEQKGPRNV